MMWAGWAIVLASATPDVESVLRSVGDTHPLYLAAQQELSGAQGDALAAEGGFDPIVKAKGQAQWGYDDNVGVDARLEQPTPLWGTTLWGGYRYGAGAFAPYDGKWKTDDAGEAVVGMSVPLWRGGAIDRRRAQVQQTKLSVRGAQAQSCAVLLDLRRQAALRFWDWVAAGERLRVAEQQLQLAVDRETAFAVRAAAGDLPRIDVVDNQRIVQGRQQRVVAARRAMEQAALELSLWYRTTSGEPIVVSDRPPPLQPATTSQADTQALLQLALQRRPEFQRLDAQINAARVERDVQENQIGPGIDVSMEAAQSARSFATPRPDLAAGVNVDIPLLFRTARGRSTSAQAAETRLLVQRRLATDRARADVLDALSAARAAEERTRMAQSEQALAAEMENAERDRYGAGDSTLFQVNLREQQSADASLTVVDAVLDTQRAAVAMAFVTAELVRATATCNVSATDTARPDPAP